MGDYVIKPFSLFTVLLADVTQVITKLMNGNGQQVGKGMQGNGMSIQQ
ncbi:MAG TPA: hypothetical protein VLA13_03535 [Massilibacterium sp.]|nr:hypothetical protein [Massilibacterium sp.]